MRAIRAHFDGRVIILDEPVELADQAEVVVLIDQESKEDARLAEETRLYYQQQSAEEKAEDESWGEGLEHDGGSAWE